MSKFVKVLERQLAVKINPFGTQGVEIIAGCDHEDVDPAATNQLSVELLAATQRLQPKLWALLADDSDGTSFADAAAAWLEAAVTLVAEDKSGGDNVKDHKLALDFIADHPYEGLGEPSYVKAFGAQLDGKPYGDRKPKRTITRASMND